MRPGYISVAALIAAAALGVAGLEAARAERSWPMLPGRASVPAQGPDRGGDVVQFAGGSIRVVWSEGDFSLTRSEILDWVRQSARATATYFGRFPVPFARLTIQPARSAVVEMGQATGRPEPRIIVTMGRRTSAEELARESLLVHEMAHLGIPDHDMRHIWLHEGLATYIEFVARAQAGLSPAAGVWGEFMREMPSGLPEGREAGGLDATRSEMRRYWGGALFCLLADIEIRKATANRLGLQDALRAMQRDGGNLTRMWTIERTLETADRATGSTAMSDLYRAMGNRAWAPDLDKLWRELGVRGERGRTVLDDGAPLAAIRRAITDRPSAPLLVSAPKLVRATRAATVSPAP